MELTGAIVSFDRVNKTGLIAVPETTVPILFLNADLQFRLPRNPIGMPVRFDVLETPGGYVAVNIRKEKRPSVPAGSERIFGLCVAALLTLGTAAAGVFLFSNFSVAVSCFLTVNAAVLLLALLVRFCPSVARIAEPLAWTLGCSGGAPMLLVLFSKFFGSFDVGGKRFLVFFAAAAQVFLFSRLEPGLFSRETLRNVQKILPAARLHGRGD